jgi:hypothetical protein
MGSSDAPVGSCPFSIFLEAISPLTQRARMPTVSGQTKRAIGAILHFGLALTMHATRESEQDLLHT